MDNTRPPMKFLISALPAVVIALLVMHFSITLAYLTPLNPLKVKVMAGLESYMRPFFEQRWELFAPNPVVDTRLMMVTCRVEGEGGQVEEKPWSNVSTPVRELKQRYRLTPADRIDRAQMTSVHLLYEPPDVLTTKLLEKPEDTPEYRKAIELIERRRKVTTELGKELLVRTASVECDRLYGRGRTKEVRVRLATVKSPPFSRRWEPVEMGSSTYSEFEWMPYQAVALY